MAYADTLTGTITADINTTIITSEGSMAGSRKAVHSVVKGLTDGSAANKATGFFSSTFTATTGGITVSLADSADPLGAAGDDTPTMDPEGLKLRALLIENQDDTNYVSVKKGTNGEASIFSGATDSIKLTAGGLFLWTSPAGVNAMNDGADDEILVTANTASCSVKITYIFG